MGEHLTDENYTLYNGVDIPCVAFGTGVVKRFYRNKYLYAKDVSMALLRSAKHGKMVRFLKNDLTIQRTLDNAIRCGYRMFDSGRLYGHSEKYIGEAVGKYSREDFFLVTKVSDIDLQRYPDAATVHDNLSLSLKFLKTDHVDAYLLHFPSGDWEAMYRDIEEEYKQGRVRSIGICNFDADELRHLLDICRIKPMICQIELHPLNTKPELRKLCQENGIRIMAHTPTAHMIKEVTDSEIMVSLVRKYNKSAAQILYRWHHQNSAIPIVSSTSEQHLKENLDILDFSLTEEEMAAIEAFDRGHSFDKNNNKINDQPAFIYNL